MLFWQAPVVLRQLAVTVTSSSQVVAVALAHWLCLLLVPLLMPLLRLLLLL
jgi:hypothetical protein